MCPRTVTFSPTLWMSTSAPAGAGPISTSTPTSACFHQEGSKPRLRCSPSGPISSILMIISDIDAHHDRNEIRYITRPDGEVKLGRKPRRPGDSNGFAESFPRFPHFPHFPHFPRGKYFRTCDSPPRGGTQLISMGDF